MSQVSQELQDQLVIRCIRGEIAESVHIGHAVITNSNGLIIAQAGDPNYLTFVRSTAKPLQAISIIEAGAVSRYQLTPAEITILCASHNGEQQHIDQVLSVLSKIGKSVTDLHCNIQDTCSGKHAGMLVMCSLMNIDTYHYYELDHPVQQLYASTVSSICNVDTSELVTATDGCGVPVFGMPLQQLAVGFASLGTPSISFHTDRKLACHTIIHALQHSPAYLAGTDRFDTDLIRATNGRIIGKMGAEGVYAFTVPGQDIGAAIKIVDGSERALYPAVVEILHQLHLLQDDELMKLRHYHKPYIFNRQGANVGLIQPECQLQMSE